MSVVARPADPAEAYALSVAETLESLGVSPEGLSPDEAAQRLASNGPNRLPEPPRDGPL